MKVIIPLAGKGTRLLPLTKDVPKPLVHVAGRPVMDYVMDTLGKLPIDEMILITGHLKEQVESYVRAHYAFPARFVEQRVQDGTAGAVNLARPFVDGPVLIVFVDTLFDADLSVIDGTDADGIIWAKHVEDYQRYGVVVTDDDGNMIRIVEKPSEPISTLANIGLYYVRDWRTLFEGIEDTLAQPKNQGEWFLTDAFQYMIDRGRRIQTAEVGGWYDCGKVETLLDTNLHLLRQGRARRPDVGDGVTITDPVSIAADVRLDRCAVGPNVTIESGSVIRGSTVVHSLVGADCQIEGSEVAYSVIGRGVRVLDAHHTRKVITDSEIGDAP